MADCLLFSSHGPAEYNLCRILLRTEWRLFDTLSYFANSYTSGSITFPSSAASGGNGLYIYSSSIAFPTQTYQAANYWVDILFAPQSGGLTASQPAKEYIYFNGKSTGGGKCAIEACPRENVCGGVAQVFRGLRKL
jgi:hypothetical protein